MHVRDLVIKSLVGSPRNKITDAFIKAIHASK